MFFLFALALVYVFYFYSSFPKRSLFGGLLREIFLIYFWHGFIKLCMVILWNWADILTEFVPTQPHLCRHLYFEFQFFTEIFAFFVNFLGSFFFNSKTNDSYYISKCSWIFFSFLNPKDLTSNNKKSILRIDFVLS